VYTTLYGINTAALSGGITMFFKQRPNADASISYFFGCSGQGKAVAIDVLANDEAWFLEQAQQLNVSISYVIDTHIHADHLSGGRKLAELARAAYAMHESNLRKTSFSFTPLADKELLSIGNTQIQILHTPGHTEDSLCLLVSDLRRTDAPWFVITGDTLFVGAVGRPDLAGHEHAMAGQLWSSLHSQLLSLPDELEIYPGHQAGSLCGVGISGKPSSTIGFEKHWNPLLAMDREAFIASVVKDLPAAPADLDQIIMRNLGY
jgi:hydroxyacylglutathione hydrolase